VLVVEDSESIQKLIAYALRARDFRVETARDGLDALEKLVTTRVDLVVTDLNMPGLDGFGLIRALRADPATAALPIIVLSAISTQDDVERGLGLGANAYLVKPLDAKRIQAEVAKYLNQPVATPGRRPFPPPPTLLLPS